VRVVNIRWDTDGIFVDDLPEEVIIDDEISPEEIADFLSDVYGWCVESFQLK